MWILRRPVAESPEETGMWRGLRLLLFQEEVLRLQASRLRDKNLTLLHEIHLSDGISAHSISI